MQAGNVLTEFLCLHPAATTLHVSPRYSVISLTSECHSVLMKLPKLN